MKDRFSGPVNHLQPRFDLKICVIIGNMHMYVYDMLLLLLESSDRKAESQLHLLLKPKVLYIHCLS